MFVDTSALHLPTCGRPRWLLHRRDGARCRSPDCTLGTRTRLPRPRLREGLPRLLRCTSLLPLRPRCPALEMMAASDQLVEPAQQLPNLLCPHEPGSPTPAYDPPALPQPRRLRGRPQPKGGRRQRARLRLCSRQARAPQCRRTGPPPHGARRVWEGASSAQARDRKATRSQKADGNPRIWNSSRSCQNQQPNISFGISARH